MILGDAIYRMTNPVSLEIKNCNSCPWFYFDIQGTVTDCRKTHYEHGGNSWYWKHINVDPLKEIPEWCPLKNPTEQTQVKKL